MPAYATPIEVVQAALHRIGEEEISTLDEDSSAARVAASNYEGIVRSVFARHAWTFARKTLDLTYQEEVELGPWRHAWVWDSEVQNISAVYVEGRRLRAGDYAVQVGRVLTRCRFEDETVQILATVRADESDWPGDVSEAVVVRMQALFLEALCDKPQDARLLKRDAEALLRDAIIRDKRQEPGLEAEFVPLAEAWTGRGYRRSRAPG